MDLRITARVRWFLLIVLAAVLVSQLSMLTFGILKCTGYTERWGKPSTVQDACPNITQLYVDTYDKALAVVLSLLTGVGLAVTRKP